MSRIRVDTAYALLILLLGTGLAGVGTALWSTSAHSVLPTTGYERLLALGAAAAGVGIIAWWIVALSIALIAGMLAGHGRISASIHVGRLAPGFMRRLVLAVLSAQLVAVPAALADSSGPASSIQTAPAQSAPAQTTPAQSGTALRPANPPRSEHTVGHEKSQDPVNPAWRPTPAPASAGPLARSPRTDYSPSENSSTADSARENSPHETLPPDGAVPHADRNSVVVRPGDTLWALVAEHMGPYCTDVEIALAWPRWHAANRAVIGADPNLILPGQVLQAPVTSG